MNKTTTPPHMPRPAPGPNTMGMFNARPAPGPGPRPLSQEELAALAEDAPLSEEELAALAEDEEEVARQTISGRDLSVQWGVPRWPAGTNISEMSPDEISDLEANAEDYLQTEEYYGYFADLPIVVKLSTEYSQYRGMAYEPYYSDSSVSSVWEDDKGTLYVETSGNDDINNPKLQPLVVARMPGENWMSWIKPEYMIEKKRGGRKKKSTKKRKSRKSGKSGKSRKSRKSGKSKKSRKSRKSRK